MTFMLDCVGDVLNVIGFVSLRKYPLLNQAVLCVGIGAVGMKNSSADYHLY